MKRYLYIPKLLTFLFASLFTLPLSASGKEQGSFSIGTFQSYKGFGLSLTSNEIHSLSVFLDMEGVYKGSTIMPGVRATYLYRCDLAEVAVKSGEVFTFYAGPGISSGYIRQDFTYGAFGAVSLAAGTRILFREHFALALDFQADLGFFCAHNDVKHSTELFFYKKGVQHALYPQLRLEYRF